MISLPRAGCTRQARRYPRAVSETVPDDDRPVLPDRSDDDRDEGWGDRPREDDDDQRFHDERPPHHDR